MGYFAGRAAPLGAVGPEVVRRPLLQLHAGPGGQGAARGVGRSPGPTPPSTARRRGARAALERALGDVEPADVTEAAELAATAARTAIRRRSGPVRRQRRACRGRPNRSTCCGTRPRCCASTAATATSPLLDGRTACPAGSATCSRRRPATCPREMIERARDYDEAEWHGRRRGASPTAA